MITLIGASGITGRLVAEQLKSAGCKARITARNQEKLKLLAAKLGNEFEYANVDVMDSSSLRRVLEASTVVINCAGPFTDLGEPVVRECARGGIHYIDTTGEQGFIRLAYERYGDEARRHNAAIVPACAVEYALADAAAAMLVERLPTCTDIQVAYCVHTLHASRGTKKSAIRVLTGEGFWREDGELKQIQPTRTHCEFEITGEGKRRGYSFPGGEVFMLPLHTRIKTISTYMVLSLPPWLVTTLSSVASKMMNSPASQLVSALIDAGGPGPSRSQRESGSFEVVCIGSIGNNTQTVTVHAADPYGLTAIIAAGVAKHIDQHGSLAVGAVAPSMVAGYKLIRELTERPGARWSVSM